MAIKTLISLGRDLFDAARAKARIEGYDSFSGYLTGIIRLDMLNTRSSDHALAQRIAGLSCLNRDTIDAKMLSNTEEALAQWKAEEMEEDSAFSGIIASVGIPNLRSPATPRKSPIDRGCERTRSTVRAKA